MLVVPMVIRQNFSCSLQALPYGNESETNYGVECFDEIFSMNVLPNIDFQKVMAPFFNDLLT